MRRFPLAGRLTGVSALTTLHPSPPVSGSWYRIRNTATQPAAAASTSGGRAVIDIYGEIGFWGVEAAQFIDELRSLDASELEIHLNSPGGDVYEGLAIYTALVDHPARIDMRVDGLAASIASIIAQAGDQITMGANSEMMIHDAWGLTIGNAADHRRSAEDLDRISNNLADVYATRAGRGTVDSWRAAMVEESWYSAQEAVDAGLADLVARPGPRQGAGGDPMGFGDPNAQWRAELASCRYLGRERAPAPPIPPRAATSDGPEGAPPDELHDREPVGPSENADPDPPVDPTDPAVEDVAGAAANLSVADVFAALARHHPPDPDAPLVGADLVTAGLERAAGTITPTRPAPPVPAPAAPEPEPPAPPPVPPPLVAPDVVTAAVDAASTTIDPTACLSAEWALASMTAYAAAPGPEPAAPDPATTNPLEDVRLNYLEVMLP